LIDTDEFDTFYIY